MDNKKGFDEVGEERRKSARILALEENENEKRKSLAANSRGKSVEGDNAQNPQMKHRAPKRGRKQKRLEDIDSPCLNENLAPQDGEDSNGRNNSTGTDRQVTELSIVPERRILDFALAVLQRRDTHNIFAQPVNPKEVENYDSIIKEPMDFGTIKTKIQEGKYTSLDQFEMDVFLICNNAMRFNASTTIYFKEARAIQILAQIVFSSLKTDPHKFESEFSLQRGRNRQKLPRKSEIKGMPTKTSRPTGLKIGASPLGPKVGDTPLTKRDDPQFYRPWRSSERKNLVPTFEEVEKRLEADDKAGERLVQSLIWYSRGLGIIPTKLTSWEAVKCSPFAEILEYNRHRRLAFLSLLQRNVSLSAQSLIPSLQNLPASFNGLLGRNTFLNLNVKPSSSARNTTQQLTNLMPPPKEPISQTTNNNGKRPMLDNCFALETPVSQPIHVNLLGKTPMLDHNIAHYTTNFNISGSSSGEKRAYPSDYTPTSLQSNTHLPQNFLPQKDLRPQNGEFYLASHLKVIPADRYNCYGKKLMTVDMLGESDSQMSLVSDYAEQSANPKPRLRDSVSGANNFPKPYNLYDSPVDTPRGIQSSGSSSVQGMVNGGHWQSVTDSNNQTNHSERIDQLLKNNFDSDDVFADLEMLLTHKYTPLPSYEELGYELKNGESDQHRHSVSVTKEVRPSVKKAGEPNLSLNL